MNRRLASMRRLAGRQAASWTAWRGKGNGQGASVMAPHAPCSAYLLMHDGNYMHPAALLCLSMTHTHPALPQVRMLNIEVRATAE